MVPNCSCPLPWPRPRLPKSTWWLQSVCAGCMPEADKGMHVRMPGGGTLVHEGAAGCRAERACIWLPYRSMCSLGPETGSTAKAQRGPQSLLGKSCVPYGWGPKEGCAGCNQDATVQQDGLII